mmetsp:Transcript_22637/g.65837  ORF Transcript_22637/g.65837 Transcript_22637/m.65837 type:complete len:237 (+) Transcript_22637:1603-2313(+)
MSTQELGHVQPFLQVALVGLSTTVQATVSTDSRHEHGGKGLDIKFLDQVLLARVHLCKGEAALEVEGQGLVQRGSRFSVREEQHQGVALSLWREGRCLLSWQQLGWHRVQNCLLESAKGRERCTVDRITGHLARVRIQTRLGDEALHVWDLGDLKCCGRASTFRQALRAVHCDRLDTVASKILGGFAELSRVLGAGWAFALLPRKHSDHIRLASPEHLLVHSLLVHHGDQVILGEE